MQVTCKAKGCSSTAEIPEKPIAARVAGFKKAGFTRLTTSSEMITVCADCYAKMSALALQLAGLLCGQEVPLWQLIPEDKRSIMKDEDLRRGKRA